MSCSLSILSGRRVSWGWKRPKPTRMYISESRGRNRRKRVVFQGLGQRSPREDGSAPAAGQPARQCLRFAVLTCSRRLSRCRCSDGALSGWRQLRELVCGPLSVAMDVLCPCLRTAHGSDKSGVTSWFPLLHCFQQKEASQMLDTGDTTVLHSKRGLCYWGSRPRCQSSEDAQRPILPLT